MKTFKEYLAENKDKDKDKDKNKMLSWNSSFREQDPIEDPTSILSWDSDFSTQRNMSGDNTVTESDEEPTQYKPGMDWHNDENDGHRITNIYGGKYNSHFHDQPTVRPRKLSLEHIAAIKNYTSAASKSKEGHASSGNMNSYLRNASGDKAQKILHGHTERNVKESVKKLSSVFTPENTNAKTITTYTAVPRHIGEKIQTAGKDSKHVFAGFTSTTSSKKTAKSFAHGYEGYAQSSDTKPEKTHFHILHITVKPKAGVSLVHHSEYGENEVLLNHGAHATYSHSEHFTNADGTTTHVHHITVGPRHQALTKYGEYNA